MTTMTTIHIALLIIINFTDETYHIFLLFRTVALTLKLIICKQISSLNLNSNFGDITILINILATITFSYLLS